ncbi:CPBP family intramembrane glutamic endopeptidase [Diaminobutyricibacter sp. McL0608]|uniref:CPBP family intramembrane glutamic endopeptidase n=1 Tax=Leifsonia sp. McL0608 TaxID=3143537 RepID=UPI0031F2F100
MARQAKRDVRAVVVWAIALLAVTALCALWLNSSGGSYRDVSPPILVIAYSPALVALAVAGFLPGAGGFRSILGQFLHWRAGVRWYALALLGPFVLVLLATAIFVGVGGHPPQQWFVVPSAAGFGVLLGPLIAGSIGEEPGWRGFGQQHLQRRLRMLGAAVIVGLLWSVWHLWPLLTPVGRADITGADVAQTFVRLISTAVVYAWLYNRSGAGLAVVMVAHAGHNLAIDFAAPEVAGSELGGWIIAALYLVAALVVVIVDPRFRRK